MSNVIANPCKMEGEFGETVGYDVKILSEEATVLDYINALNDCCENLMAECRGCDGCCHERAPLMICDFYLSGQENILSWINKTGNIYSKDGAVDIMLKRDDESACIFLNKVKKECKDHLHRPFVCRTHFCLPQTDNAYTIREELVNKGIDALVYQLSLEKPEYAEEYHYNIEDYENNPLNSKDWGNVLLKDILSPALFDNMLVK